MTRIVMQHGHKSNNFAHFAYLTQRDSNTGAPSELCYYSITVDTPQ
jgi:hypothetical protein